MVICIVCGLVGNIIGIAAIILSFHTGRAYGESKKRCTAIVDDTLIKFVAKEFTNEIGGYLRTDTRYFPVYEYIIDGKRYELESGIGSNVADEALIGKKGN